MSLRNNRSIYSILNAISAMCLTLVNGLFGIVVTRLIIEHFGSDFNGLNSTANQVVHVLLIVEGGFTTASNVALFAPTVRGDYGLSNGILSATRNKFRRIGIMFFAVGTLVSVGYALVANSGLPREFIFTVVMMTMIPPAFNLYYATTYRVLLQAQQKEYIISLFTACTIGLGHICNIAMILLGGPMWMVRVNTMTFALLNSLLIAGYVKRANKFLDLSAAPRPELIKGTGDVMVQRISSVIYDSAPIIFLSVLPAGGTLLASVYAVYNNVFIILKSLLRGIIDAPRLSFGQLLTERRRCELWPAFAQYEFAAFSAIFVLLSTCCTLIMPFIGLYMDGITDANYYDRAIAILMVLISAIEVLRIPSCHLINMAGQFRISRNFQAISCIVLLIAISVGGMLWGVYGMLGAVLLVAVLLAVLEMGYVHTRFFRGKLPALLRLVLPLAAAGVAVCALELRLPIRVNSYLSFILCGILFVCVNGLAALIIGFLFNRRELTALVKRVLRILKR